MLFQLKGILAWVALACFLNNCEQIKCFKFNDTELLQNALANPCPEQGNHVRTTRGFVQNLGICEYSLDNDINLLNLLIHHDVNVIYNVCFNTEKRAALYVHSHYTKNVGVSTRADFLATCMPTGTNNFYTNTAQNLEQLNLYTGLHARFALPGKQLQVERGHLAPNGDYATPQCSSTSYYVNAAPQWSYINNGNWGLVEDNLRNSVDAEPTIQAGEEVEIMTGTLGILKVNGNAIFIGHDEIGNLVIPFPKFFWKVAFTNFFRMQDNAAVVVANDAHFDIKEAKEACTPLSASKCPAWVRYNDKRFQTVARGYTFCCSVAELFQNARLRTQSRFVQNG